MSGQYRQVIAPAVKRLKGYIEECTPLLNRNEHDEAERTRYTSGK